MNILPGHFTMRRFLPLAAMLVVGVGSVLWLAWEASSLRDDLKALQAEKGRFREKEGDYQAKLAAAESRADRLAAELKAQQRRQDALAAELERRPQPVGTDLEFTLRQALRSEGEGTAALSPTEQTSGVVFRLEWNRAEGEFPSYRVTLQTVDGATVRVSKPLPATASGDLLRLAYRVPVVLLPPDDYFFRLEGLSPSGPPQTVGEYFFRVNRENGNGR